MTLTVHTELVQGSDEWHDVRRGIVTASTVGNLITTRRLAALDYDCPDCGAEAQNPCRSKTKAGAVIKTLHTDRAEVARRSPSPLIFETASNDISRSLTLVLTAERINGWTEESYINDAMWRGIEDEPKARAVYAEHYAPVTEVGFMIEDRWGYRIGYSPDGLVGDDGLIEIKSRSPKAQLATILADVPPTENMPQLQAGLLVSGRKWLDYVSFAAGMPMFVKRVYPDPKWFDAITNAVAAFEANATEMMRVYDEATTHLHPTERTIDHGLVI